MNGKSNNPHNCNGVGNDMSFKISSDRDRSSDIEQDLAIPISRPPGVFMPLAITCAVAFLCYVNSLNNTFVFDDSEAVVNNEDLHPEVPLTDLFKNDFWGTPITHNSSHKSYRPLTVLSFRLNYWLGGGLRPWGFHLTNVLLHTFLSGLALLVYDTLFGLNNLHSSFLSALLFAAHPIHSEAVAGVVGRADLLCAVFYFISLLFYARAVKTGNYTFVIFTMITTCLAMLCKEQGIAVLGVCSIYDVLVSRINPLHMFTTLRSALPFLIKTKTTDCCATDVTENGVNDVIKKDHVLRKLILRHLLMLLAGTLMIYIRWKIMDFTVPTFQKVDNPASFADSILTRILTYNYIYGLNIWLLICPEWLCFDWSMGCIPLLSLEESFDYRILIVFIFWVASTSLLTKIAMSNDGVHQRNLILCVALIVIPFLPASNLFFRVGFVIAERVLYLPSFGYCMLIVLGLRQLAIEYDCKNVLRICYSFLLLIFQFRSICRSAEWHSETVLYRSGVSVCPLNAKIHYNIAKNAADGGNKTYAVQEYREALRLNPDYDQAMNNLANILRDEGNLNEAEKLLRKAVSLRHDFAAAWMNLGILLSGQKRYEEAESCYFTALRHRYKYPDCYYNIGNLYLEMEKYDEAYNAWRNATRLKPLHKMSWSNMIIMLDSLGRLKEAEEVARQALSLLPSEASLHFNLANALGKSNNYEEAEKHFVHAIALSPGNPAYYTNFGVLYHRWKKYNKAEKLYRHALELNPNHDSARENLALLMKTVKKNSHRQ